MGKVRVASFSVSIDGYGAGPRQDVQNPLGVRGMELHNWFFPTNALKQMTGKNGAPPASTTIWLRGHLKTSVRGFLAATCLARYAVRGRTIHRKGGGASSLRITHRFL